MGYRENPALAKIFMAGYEIPCQMSKATLVNSHAVRFDLKLFPKSATPILSWQMSGRMSFQVSWI
jgi:hypothetical protein